MTKEPIIILDYGLRNCEELAIALAESIASLDRISVLNYDNLHRIADDIVQRGLSDDDSEFDEIEDIAAQQGYTVISDGYAGATFVYDGDAPDAEGN